MPIETKPNIETKLDFISEEMCPDAGQAIGEHFFRVCEPNTPCNCTLWLIIWVKFPRICLKYINGMSVIITLGEDGNRIS